MTSTRKIESNKSNASRSTGPRTPGGKIRSRNNAYRHGLATRIDHNPDVKARIGRLAAILIEESDDLSSVERFLGIAECHFDLQRIRSARYEVFTMRGDFENLDSNELQAAVREIDRIGRYERRALSKRKRASKEPPTDPA